MLAWTSQFPLRRRPLGYLRLILARHRYWDRIGLRFRGSTPGFEIKQGYQQRIARLRHRHEGRRGFVLCNGPGLKDLDLGRLRNEVTIGCNGLYRSFGKFGFHTNYLLFEDIEQTELRGPEIHRVKGPVKLAALYNAYAFRADADTLFFNAPRLLKHYYYWARLYPQFSKDFAVVAHLGSTVAFLMLQWAFYLGCDPVYIVGLDHDYGELPKRFPPGKIVITQENIDLVRGLHFSDAYYKIGDKIGVPNVEMQEKAFACARDAFASSDRRLYNASSKTKLDLIERVDYDSLFPDRSREPAR